MGFFVLLLNKELSPARVASLLGRLFAIEAASVAELLSTASSQLYYEIRLLQQDTVPRSDDPAAIFFVELCIYPHGQLQALYDSDQAVARAFSHESQLPVIVGAQNKLDPYRWLLFEAEQVYEVDEWPEDEETAAITVTRENKTRRPSR
ncbi:hypothetical protein I2I05_00980 [Hymenobacter sp. BT683]|uniref:Uncharacterized protein n=1 Tax=Hymenobacter jeongseonensis TaxID=2791027 RepID=A0ABS0IDB6_9BACT|nr:hypothetical protein [Hymenobacter jeongseonensis]MBF9235958.1 hypothetical protein [Hymenobacter jeongseonensis]